jgi:hypothetical protein
LNTDDIATSVLSSNIPQDRSRQVLIAISLPFFGLAVTFADSR